MRIPEPKKVYKEPSSSPTPSNAQRPKPEMYLSKFFVYSKYHTDKQIGSVMFKLENADKPKSTVPCYTPVQSDYQVFQVCICKASQHSSVILYLYSLMI